MAVTGSGGLKNPIKSGIRFFNANCGRKTAEVTKTVLRAVFLLGMGYVMLYPILFMVSGAFKAGEDVYDPTVIWIPKNFSFQAFELAVDTLKFWESLKQTLIILLPSVCLQMISTLLAGYGFARFKFKERLSTFITLLEHDKSINKFTTQEKRAFRPSRILPKVGSIECLFKPPYTEDRTYGGVRGSGKGFLFTLYSIYFFAIICLGLSFELFPKLLPKSQIMR